MSITLNVILICAITAALTGIYLFFVLDKLPIVTPSPNYIEAFENLLKGAPSTPNNKYLQAIVTVNGFEIKAYLAVTNEQHIKGLSIKNHLQENEGMFFVFERPARYGFWMKDMKFPIDIIWLNSNGTVIHVEKHLSPCQSNFQCPTYIPEKDSLYVLETVSGFSQKHNITIGTHINFRMIR